MRKPDVAAAIFLVVICTFGIWSGDWLHAKWFPLSLFGAYCVMVPLWNISKTGALAIGYSVGNGLWNAMSEFSTYSDIPDVAQIALRVESLRAVLFLVFLVIIFSDQARTVFIARRLWLICLIAAWFNIVSYGLKFPVLTGVFAGKSSISGMSFNKSLSSTLVALLFPFLIESYPASYMIWLVPFVSVIYLKGSIATFAIIGAATSYWFARNPTLKNASIISGICIALIFSAYLFFDDDLWNFSGRIEIWKNTMTMFKDYPDKYLFGFGLGTYYNYGFTVVKMFHMEPPRVFLTLHNDILQCLFELGIVGLTLWTSFFIQTTAKAFKEPWLFSFLVSVGISMFGNYPCHLALEAMIIACGFSLIWLNKGNLCQTRNITQVLKPLEK